MTPQLADSKSRYSLGLLRLYTDRFERKPIWKSVHYLHMLGLIGARQQPLYFRLKRRLFDESFLSSIHWDGKCLRS